MSKLLKVKQVRRRLGKNSDGAVYDLVRKGLLPPGVVVRFGWAIMFNEDALEEFISKGGTMATPKDSESRTEIEAVN